MVNKGTLKVVPPNDQRGKDATQYKAGVSPRGLQIPLVVGRVRSCAVAGKASNTLAEGKAVDVLIHPWVMDQIQGEGPRGGPWRAEIAALAVSWVAKETKLPLDSGWKHINSSTRAAWEKVRRARALRHRRSAAAVEAARGPQEEGEEGRRSRKASRVARAITERARSAPRRRRRTCHETAFSETVKEAARPEVDEKAPSSSAPRGL